MFPKQIQRTLVSSLDLMIYGTRWLLRFASFSSLSRTFISALNVFILLN